MSVDFAGFLGVVLLAYLVPGPDFLVIVRAAARRKSLGRAAAFGAQAGLCVHMSAAAMGLSVLAARSALAFTVIKLAGAAYLVYLGARTLVTARRESAGRRTDTPPAGSPRHPISRYDRAIPGPGSAEADPDRRTPLRSNFTQGFLTNVLNPKAALFFLSVLPQFIDRRDSMPGQILLLGMLDVVIGTAYWMGLVVVAARLRGLLDRPAFRRRWEKTTGWLFIAVGAGVASTG